MNATITREVKTSTGWVVLNSGRMISDSLEDLKQRQRRTQDPNVTFEGNKKITTRLLNGEIIRTVLEVQDS